MNLYVITSALTAVTSISVGVFVYLKNPKAIVNKTWFGLSISIAFWSSFLTLMYTSKTFDSCLFYSKMIAIGISLIPSIYLHFIISLVNYPKERKVIIRLSYIISLFFLLFSFSPYIYKAAIYNAALNCYYPTGGILYYFYILFYFLSFIYSIYLMIKTLSIEKGFKRNQIMHMIGASFVGFLSASTLFPLSFGIQILPIGTYFTWLYTLIVAIAIVRYQFFGITIAVTRLGIFSLVYFLVLGVPFIIAKKTQPFLNSYLGQNWWLMPLGLMAIFATAGPFIYSYLQRQAESHLRRKEFLAHEALNNLTQDMMKYTNIDVLLRFIVERVYEIMNVDSVRVYLKDEAKSCYMRRSTYPLYEKGNKRCEFFDNSLLVKTMLLNKTPIITEELRFKQVSDDLQHELEDINAALVIPTFKAGTLFGFLTLGQRKDNKIFTKEDLNILITLTNQAVLAIDNAKAYEELMDTRDQLIKVEKLATMGELASEVAHEIKNPLQAIKTFTELIPTRYKDKDFRDKFSKLAMEEINRIDNFVRKLISVTHPLPPKLSPTDVNEVISSVLDLLDNDFRAKNIKIKKELQTTPVRIEADKDQLKQVFLNLVSNAIDAMDNSKEKALAVKTSSYHSHAIIKIQDTGCGIPHESIPRLFNPLFTTKEKGSGLGLNIVDTIIRNHKGTIDVESKVGEGTTFVINI
ncbi:MAG: ATP-binding protein [Candidatus Omnitrophota bacterium]